MDQNYYYMDAICQVLVSYKSRTLVDALRQRFLPTYEELNLDYAGKPDDEAYEFQSEDELLNCYLNTPKTKITFYWKSKNKHPDNLMLGVNILKDDQMVISLTVDGVEATVATYYQQLKQFLASDIGVISYFNPAPYKDGEDFKAQYAGIHYSFEN